jgi:hypothetical protein
MRERWFGATGHRVPEIAVAGEDLELLGGDRVRLDDKELDALVLADVADRKRMHEVYEAGVPIVVRAETAKAVQDALAHPEVACVVVPASARELRELDLTKLTYG